MNILPLAYTKLKAFENCPRQGYARYISKTYPFVKTPDMEKGIKMHAMFESRVKNDTPFPAEFSWCDDFMPSRNSDTRVYAAECSLGIESDNSACSFFESSCYFRGKIDLLNIEGDTAFLIDWKTGKPYEDPDELNLHAMLAKAHYPDVKHWRGMYVWLREKRIGDMHTLSPGKTYHKLLDRVSKLKIGDFPRKNPLCPWCDLTSCEYYPES
jgi:hypothetical protein